MISSLSDFLCLFCMVGYTRKISFLYIHWTMESFSMHRMRCYNFLLNIWSQDAVCHIKDLFRDADLESLI